MTARQIFEATLIELNKIHAPSLKLYEFNYLINKIINSYISKRCAKYDINQKSSDDLRVLTTTAYITPTPYNRGISSTTLEATYEAQLPLDYLHLLNCICVFKVAKTNNCFEKDTYIEVPATRLTADSWGLILTDVYNRPSPKKPYYYLHNQSNSNHFPTDLITEVDAYGMPNGTDMSGIYNVTTLDGSVAKPTSTTSIGEDTLNVGSGSNFPRTIKLDLTGNGTPETNVSLVEKPIALRAGNPSPVRIEVRYGKSNAVYLLEELQVDYIRTPLYIRLTQNQIDLTQDTSQIMEFPDYVTYEIINELAHAFMMHINDPRLRNRMALDLPPDFPTS